MKRAEHLLCILSEECHELGKLAMKAARFGVDDVQPGRRPLNERIVLEFADICATMEMLYKESSPLTAAEPSSAEFAAMMEAKKRRVEEYLLYSAERGTLDVPQSVPEGDFC